MNFAPAHVHQVNNKSRLLAELKEIKRKTRHQRKAYWEQNQNPGSTQPEGGCPDKGPARSVDPEANTEGFFNINQRILKMRVLQPKTTHLIRPFCLIEKKLDTGPKALDSTPRGVSGSAMSDVRSKALPVRLVVAVKEASLYPKQDDESEKVAQLIQGETLVPIVQSSGGNEWYMVRTQMGMIGWVNSTDVREEKVKK